MNYPDELFPHKDKQGRPIIDKQRCSGCGVEVPKKINVAGCVYVYCNRVVGINEETGKDERCYTRSNWGRLSSQEQINEYLSKNSKKSELENVEQDEYYEDDGQNRSRGDGAAIECGGRKETAPRSTIGAALGNLLGGAGESVFD